MIHLNELLKDFAYIEFDENAFISEKNSIIFGPNGSGKSTIYKALKENYSNYAYLDYDEMRTLFLKNNEKIVISLGAEQIENINSRIEEIGKKYDLKRKFKELNITSQSDANKISLNCKQKFKSGKFTIIDLSKYQCERAALVKPFLTFAIKNYEKLKTMGDIKNDLKLVDQSYLKQALLLIDKHIDSNDDVCPLCGNKVANLKQLIDSKIASLSDIKDSLVQEFSDTYQTDNADLIFDTMTDLCNNLTEDNLIDLFLTQCNWDFISELNQSLEELKSLEKQKHLLLTKQHDLYYSLRKNKDTFTSHLINHFGAEVSFSEDSFEVYITLPRKVKLYSTGEINLVLFVTSVYGFLGSNKNLLVIDDPVSSYDLPNQYNIMFQLCKIIEPANKKNVLIFTHNLDVINIAYSQNPKSYTYYFIENIYNKRLIKNIDLKNSSNSDLLSIENLTKDDETELHKYINLLLKADIDDIDAHGCDYSRSLLHYDKGFIRNESGLTNEFFINYIEDDIIETINGSSSFREISINKILALASIRIWIEYKMESLTNCCLSGTFGQKLNDFFYKNKPSDHPKITKEILMSKKVMINQNCHSKSQKMPFYFALSLTIDDIRSEIKEIKSLFES